jgi:hypothetical protein
MSLAKKLNFKPGQSVEVVGRPDGVDLGDVEVVDAGATGGVIVFARVMVEVDERVDHLRAALGSGRLAWVLYPKAGQLGTDLNRDILWRHLGLSFGLKGNRQVSVDDVWSAMRFKLAESGDTTSDGGASGHTAK